MNNWITIRSFTYPHEAHMAKAMLESEGIEVFIKDELTAQVNNFYSNAIGGVKLLVKQSDYSQALSILVEAGYISEKVTRPGTIYAWFDTCTSKLPLLGKSALEVRLIIMVAFLLIMLMLPVYILLLPSTRETLADKVWCVEKIYYKGRELKPVSGGINLDEGKCAVTMSFNTNGMAFMPGCNSYDDIAHWELRNDSLIINARIDERRIAFSENQDRYPENDTITNLIYLRAYSLRIKDNQIRLQSDSVLITGKKQHFNSTY